MLIDPVIRLLYQDQVRCTMNPLDRDHILNNIMITLIHIMLQYPILKLVDRILKSANQSQLIIPKSNNNTKVSKSKSTNNSISMVKH